MMQKQPRSTSPLKTILALNLAALAALAATKLPAQAQGKGMLFQLAHTPVAEVEGSHTLVPGKGGGYDFLQYTPTKTGDAITFTVRMTEPGYYRVQTTSYKDGAEGIYSLEIDGQEISRKDFYQSNVWEVGQFEVKPGIYQVTYRCVGKNPKSSGIGVQLGNLHFR